MELPNNHVYSISEESHGTLAVASSVKAAIAYLINNAWLTDDSCTWVADVGWVTIKKHFGEDWKQVVMEMTLDQFNDEFLDEISISEEPLFMNETVE